MAGEGDAARAVPQVPPRSHWRGEADAFLERHVKGREVVMATTGGKLDVGPGGQILREGLNGRRKEDVLERIAGK